MKIALIGSGTMGSALAKQISKNGHTLVITGRNADKAKELARATGAVYKDQAAAAEEIQKAVPGAKVVKAFNTVFAQVIAGGAKLNGETVPVYFAGDDAAAKDTVKSLILSMAFAPVDAGGLRNARYLEPLAGLNIYFAFGAERGRSIAPAWIGIQ